MVVCRTGGPGPVPVGGRVVQGEQAAVDGPGPAESRPAQPGGSARVGEQDHHQRHQDLPAPVARTAHVLPLPHGLHRRRQCVPFSFLFIFFLIDVLPPSSIAVFSTDPSRSSVEKKKREPKFNWDTGHFRCCCCCCFVEQEQRHQRCNDVHVLVHRLPDDHFRMLDILVAHLKKYCLLLVAVSSPLSSLFFLLNFTGLTFL